MDYPAEVAHFKTQHIAYRKTGLEWEIFGRSRHAAAPQRGSQGSISALLGHSALLTETVG